MPNRILNTNNKLNAKDETKVKDKNPSVKQADSKLLNLASTDEAFFMRLAKSKKPEQKAEIFAISMQNIEYQLNKETKPLTDPKKFVSTKYHNFFDVYSKDNFDILRSYGKYNYKIKLFKDQKLSNLSHSAFQRMSVKFVNKFFEKNPKKKFIKAYIDY